MSEIKPVPVGIFTNSETIYKVEFGNKCKIIEDGAFENCCNLSTINKGNILEKIGNRAFAKTKISNVTFNNVETIGNSAFENCESLTTISINTSCSSIGNSAFKGCISLTSFVIPTGVETIMDNTFSYCGGLTSITIPNSVTSIGDYVFYKCTGLTSIKIPNSVTSIGKSAFNGCTELTEVHINDLATWCNISFDSSNANPLCYAKNLYLNNKSVKTLVIPDNITNINNYAFYNCDIDKIYIHGGEKTFGEKTFFGCSGHDVYNYTNMDIKKNSEKFGYIAYGANNVYNIIDDIFVFITDKNGNNILVDYLGNSQDIYLPESYKNGSYTIKNTVFSNNTNITSIKIPNKVTSIEEGSFDGCTGLTKVEIDCKNIDNWFKNNTSIKNVIIGNNVTSIGDYAFSGCFNLTGISVESGNTIYDSRNNCNAIIETATNKLIAGCQNTTIPNSVTNIGDYAFYCCSNLTNIKIPNIVASIGGSAFENCINLETVEINENCVLTSINNYAFKGCEKLTTLNLPDGLKNIGKSAFENCKNYIVKINISGGEFPLLNPRNLDLDLNLNDTLPTSLESIGNACFKNTGIETLIITKNNKLTNIPESAFENCKKLKTLNISNSNITTIGSKAFYNYNELSILNLPNKTEHIGDDAFNSEEGNNIISVTLPSNLISLGNNSLYTVLKINVDKLLKNPPVFTKDGENSDESKPFKDNVTISIYKDIFNTYIDNYYWKKYKNVITKDYGKINDYISNISVSYSDNIGILSIKLKENIPNEWNNKTFNYKVVEEKDNNQINEIDTNMVITLNYMSTEYRRGTSIPAPNTSSGSNGTIQMWGTYKFYITESDNIPFDGTMKHDINFESLS